eukprot:3646527-Rhodomonas_salina.3
MLTDAQDPLKQHFIKAKTAGEVESNDAAPTRWDSMIGLLHPEGAKFRIFTTTGDTLDQIFDHMANSCYKVFIAHCPKLLECARARNILCLDLKQSFLLIPISSTSGKGTGTKCWYDEAIEASFSFKTLWEEPSFQRLARLFVL